MSDKFEYKIVEYKGVKTVQHLVDLLEAVEKVVPDLVYKLPENKGHNYYKPDDLKDVDFKFAVFHTSDLQNSIGHLAVDFREAVYHISGKNVASNRYDYRTGEDTRYSKHLKNIVNIAKKAFKPLTLQQIADSSDRETYRMADEFRDNIMREAYNQTGGAFNVAFEDMLELYAIGYQPKNPKFGNAIKYVVDNLERIKKYHNYKPNLMCVRIKKDGVEYAPKGDMNNIKIAPSKDNLPDDIKGKLCVLDIVNEPKTFVEDVGRKVNDNIYWVLV